MKVNQPASFAVRLNGAQGKMQATVHSPSGALDECAVTELEKGERERERSVFGDGGYADTDFSLFGADTAFAPSIYIREITL